MLDQVQLIPGRLVAAVTSRENTLYVKRKAFSLKLEHAIVDNLPAGLRWIKLVLKQELIQRRMLFLLYFCWPNQPSKGRAQIYFGSVYISEIFKSLIQKPRSLNFK